ncbi:5437_t:CDS:2, partial [Diversispora eburnea]
LSEKNINISKIEDASEAYSDFLTKEEVNLPFILDEVNAIMHQMNSEIHVREFENAMRDLLKSTVHVVAMDVFANEIC